MPSEKSPGPIVKDDATYEALRDQGATKQKAAGSTPAVSYPET